VTRFSRIDLPQPAHAALLIFLQQQRRAFGLRAHVGIGLELARRPARDGEDADDRHAQHEQHGQQLLKADGRLHEQQRAGTGRR
jgi:Flp pilus assembly protein CpaB